jgi:hypothetical protein
LPLTTGIHRALVPPPVSTSSHWSPPPFASKVCRNSLISLTSLVKG